MKKYPLIILVFLLITGCQCQKEADNLHYGAIINTSSLNDLPDTIDTVNVLPGPFVWGEIVTKPEQPENEWDWSKTDALISEAKNKNVDVVATIWPYALWDQANCHGDWSSNFSLLGEAFRTPYTPCDFTAYAIWITAVVARYGSSVSAWQIMQYPESQDTPLAFFQGSSQDYYQIIQTTTEAIKQSQSDAVIVSATIGKLTPKVISFWGPLFETDLKSNFTILSINAETPEDLVSTNSWLNKYNLNQTQWITTTNATQAVLFGDSSKVFYTIGHD